MLRAAAPLVACMLAAVGGAAAGEAEDRVAQAKQHYAAGMAHYRASEWDAAVDEFSAGYMAKADPVFLFNIAQAHRLAGHHQKALDYYEKYLDGKPPNAAEVRGRIRELRKLIKEQPAEVKPVVEEKPKPVEEKPKPVVEEKPKPAVAPAALQADVRTEAPSAPVYKRWWFWTGAVVLVAAIAAGVTLGVVFSAPREPMFPELMAQ